MRIYLEIDIRRIDCRSCQGVKQERLDWLANNPFYTKRFAFHIGRRCRNSSIRDVAKEQLLDWKTVKALEMQYMREQIKRAGHPRPRVFGVDEISIRKGSNHGARITAVIVAYSATGPSSGPMSCWQSPGESPECRKDWKPNGAGKRFSSCGRSDRRCSG
jgi:transposase